MKPIFRACCFLLLVSLPCAAQNKSGTIKVKKKDDEKEVPKLDSTYHPTLWSELPNTLFYGRQTFDLSDLNKGLFQNGNAFTGEQVIYGVELFGMFTQGRSGNYPSSTLCYTRISPQKISDSDSSSWILSGFKFHVINMGLDVFRKVKWFDLLLYPGFEYGRLRLDHKLPDGTDWKYKNPFFTFNPMVDIRFNLFAHQRFTIAARAGYNYDVGNPRWIGTKGNGPHLPGTFNRGYYYAGILSFRFW